MQNDLFNSLFSIRFFVQRDYHRARIRLLFRSLVNSIEKFSTGKEDNGWRINR